MIGWLLGSKALKVECRSQSHNDIVNLKIVTWRLAKRHLDIASRRPNNNEKSF